TTTGEERGQLPIDGPNIGPLLAFSPDGKLLAVHRQLTKNGTNIQLWDLAERKKRLTLASTTPLTIPRAMIFSPDGKRLAGIARSGDAFFLWDTTTGRIIGKKVRLTPPEANGLSLAFSPDGKTLALGGDAKNKVRLLDATTLKDQAELKIPPDIKAGSINQLAFSPDGQLLAGAYCESPGQAEQRGVLLWSTSGVKKTRWLPERYGIRLTFAPDGKTLACHDATSSEIRLWDVAAGRQLQRRPGHDTSVHTLAISPDGQIIVSGDYQPALRLWDTATGKPLLAMKGDDDWTYACLFSPDGKQMISAGVVGTFQVWDVATGKERRRFEIDWPDRGLVDLQAVGISADGKRLAAVALGGQRSHPAQTLVWDIATGKQQHPRPYKLEERPYGEPPMPWLSQAHAAFAPESDWGTVW